jgi:plasmid maintenance system antidote protein VapI
MQTKGEAPNAPVLRGEIAKARLHIYEIAPRVPVHPRTLGELLNERRPLTPAAAERILVAIREVEMQKRSAGR